MLPGLAIASWPVIWVKRDSRVAWLAALRSAGSSIAGPPPPQPISQARLTRARMGDQIVRVRFDRGRSNRVRRRWVRIGRIRMGTQFMGLRSLRASGTRRPAAGGYSSWARRAIACGVCVVNGFTVSIGRRADEQGEERPENRVEADSSRAASDRDPGSDRLGARVVDRGKRFGHHAADKSVGHVEGRGVG